MELPLLLVKAPANGTAALTVSSLRIFPFSSSLLLSPLSQPFSNAPRQGGVEELHKSTVCPTSGLWGFRVEPRTPTHYSFRRCVRV
ncbi:hypothetical protein KOW79_009962 [Hemibagrus wyckioides]|uniref:Uncharacterized protein n=1 Tax=Hemibagrus wyckioides TaxID=337641 RepID=A0A9D3NN45_9TELE|nr:hypothetical protein KOW79_009962 [Hemibagrus wyckioides]